ncbi:type I methionyl aminopeptidase [Candidatus Peregrinibacteria bacterium CG10_big_fil_rev_8_21_14_0_10_49_10]|nr:MAG: type I methionyl aminopeptidase [Candidatus Peregrinibacteria bacterium CG10_big_fil_rev_8_21_14_0_10_49_10]
MSDIQVLTEAEIASARHGGKILRACLTMIAALVEPGITTRFLDEKAEEFITSHQGAVPAFKGYQNYPATICASVNEECVHGIPSERVLAEGDIIALDCGVLFDGLYTDACVSVGVGTIRPNAQHLLDVTQHALDAALAIIRKHTKVGDISSTIQTVVESAGFHPVRSLTGHGLGRTLHQFPDIPNLGTPETGAELPVGALIAIEPIVSAGSDEITEGGDGWTLSIRDGSLSAHVEHTVLVHAENCEIIA